MCTKFNYTGNLELQLREIVLNSTNTIVCVDVHFLGNDKCDETRDYPQALQLTVVNTAGYSISYRNQNISVTIDDRKIWHD